MASIKAQLKADIEIRFKILVICKEVLKFSGYLTNPDTAEERNYIHRDLHLSFINWSMWRMSIIELAKLFSNTDNQKYNLIKLIGKIKPQGTYRSLKFDQDTLSQWDEKLNRHEIAITEITRLRNRLYAHTDDDPFVKPESNLTIKDCMDLAEFAEEIIRTISGTLTKEDYFPNTVYFDSKDFDMVKILVSAEEQELQQVMKQTGMNYKDLFGN